MDDKTKKSAERSLDVANSELSVAIELVTVAFELLEERDPELVSEAYAYLNVAKQHLETSSGFIGITHRSLLKE
jgi:hypothetical protein